MKRMRASIGATVRSAAVGWMLLLAACASAPAGLGAGEAQPAAPPPPPDPTPRVASVAERDELEAALRWIVAEAAREHGAAAGSEGGAPGARPDEEGDAP